MSIGIISKCQERLDKIIEECQAFGLGLRNQQQLLWMMLPQATDVSNFDFDKWHEEFDRSEAEEVYVKAATEVGGGTRQDMAIAKFQSDLLAGMERDLGMRKRSRIRRLAHESCAKRHLGSNKGFIQTGYLAYLQTQLQRVSSRNV